jgi:hypothetical protein
MQNLYCPAQAAPCWVFLIKYLSMDSWDMIKGQALFAEDEIAKLSEIRTGDRINVFRSRCLSISSARKRTLNLLQRLSEFFAPVGRPTASTLWVYVQCNRCGEKIGTRLNLHNDLSVQYGKFDKHNIYFIRKKLIGRERCFYPIDVELTFDNRRQLTDRKIQGGKFITEKEFRLS